MVKITFGKNMMKFKLGRFGFKIGHKYYRSSIQGLTVTSPDIGTWYRFFPGLWWQTDKPQKTAEVIPIWKQDKKKFLPECIRGNIITEADLEWSGEQCDWKTYANIGRYPKIVLRCETCGEVKDKQTGRVILKGANTWRKENENQ